MSGPKVAIIGSCQVGGIAESVRKLLPGAGVKAWHVGVTPETPQEILAEIPTFDLVITQLADHGPFTDILGLSKMNALHKSVIHVPIFAFTGFHPDWIYIRDGSSVLKGVYSDYHSAIAVASFVNGYDAFKAAHLYNYFIFSYLAYFDVYEVAKSNLLNTFKAHGFDLTEYIAKWTMEVGQFMYSLNHPHIRVLADLTKMALERGGYIEGGIPVPHDIPDYLGSQVILPGFPSPKNEIVTSGRFQVVDYSTQPHSVRHIDLGTYLIQAFDYYKTIPVEKLDVDQIPSIRKKLQEVVI